MFVRAQEIADEGEDPAQADLAHVSTLTPTGPTLNWTGATTQAAAERAETVRPAGPAAGRPGSVHRGPVDPRTWPCWASANHGACPGRTPAGAQRRPADAGPPAVVPGPVLPRPGPDGLPAGRRGGGRRQGGAGHRPARRRASGRDAGAAGLGGGVSGGGQHAGSALPHRAGGGPCPRPAAATGTGAVRRAPGAGWRLEHGTARRGHGRGRAGRPGGLADPLAAKSVISGRPSGFGAPRPGPAATWERRSARRLAGRDSDDPPWAFLPVAWQAAGADRAGPGEKGRCRGGPSRVRTPPWNGWPRPGAGVCDACGVDALLEDPDAWTLWSQWLLLLLSQGQAEEASAQAQGADWPPLLRWLEEQTAQDQDTQGQHKDA